MPCPKTSYVIGRVVLLIAICCTDSSTNVNGVRAVSHQGDESHQEASSKVHVSDIKLDLDSAPVPPSLAPTPLPTLIETHVKHPSNIETHSRTTDNQVQPSVAPPSDNANQEQNTSSQRVKYTTNSITSEGDDEGGYKPDNFNRILDNNVVVVVLAGIIGSTLLLSVVFISTMIDARGRDRQRLLRKRKRQDEHGNELNTSSGKSRLHSVPYNIREEDGIISSLDDMLMVEKEPPRKSCMGPILDIFTLAMCTAGAPTQSRQSDRRSFNHDTFVPVGEEGNMTLSYSDEEFYSTDRFRAIDHGGPDHCTSMDRRDDNYVTDSGRIRNQQRNGITATTHQTKGRNSERQERRNSLSRHSEQEVKRSIASKPTASRYSNPKTNSNHQIRPSILRSKTTAINTTGTRSAHRYHKEPIGSNKRVVNKPGLSDDVDRYHKKVLLRELANLRQEIDQIEEKEEATGTSNWDFSNMYGLFTGTRREPASRKHSKNSRAAAASRRKVRRVPSEDISSVGSDVSDIEMNSVITTPSIPEVLELYEANPRQKRRYR